MKYMTSQINKAANPAHHFERNVFAWSLLAGLILFIALAGPFFAGRIYSLDDLGAYHLPIRAFYAQQLARGQAFDWMPQIFSGFYLTGEGQAGTYHPLHLLLYTILPLRSAMALEWLIGYPVMLVGTWLFLRRAISSNSAAMFGSVVFTFSSFNLLHFIHPNCVEIIAHIPWLLWAIDIVLVDSDRRKVYFAMTAMALLTGSQLLLGYPQFVFISLITEFFYAIYVLIIRHHVPRSGCNSSSSCTRCIGCYTSTWPDLVLAKCIGLFLGGAQLLPTFDVLLHSSRQSADAAFAYTGSMHPLNLLQLVAPYLFVNRVVGLNTHELGLYLGAVPLTLIVLLIIRVRYLGGMKLLAAAAGLFGVMALILAFGQYGQIYHLLTYLPLVGNFRFPARHIVLFQLSAAVLASMGFLVLLRLNREHSRQAQVAQAFQSEINLFTLSWSELMPLWMLAAVSAAIAVVGIIFHNQPYIATLPVVVIGPILFFASAWLVSCAVRGSILAIPALIILTAVDLGAYGLSYSVYPGCPSMDEFVAKIPTPPEETAGRVVLSLFRFDETGGRIGDQIILRGWSRADGYAGLEPQRQLDYKQLPALRVAGVRWVRRGTTTEGIKGLVARDENWSEAPDPLPRVRLVTQTIASDRPAVEIGKIDIESTAITEVPLIFPEAKSGSATLIEDSPGRLVVRTEAPSPQLLVISESYHPGWKASVNGEASQIYRINGDYMGCVVQPGEQWITLQFQPSSLRTGRLITYLGLGFLPFCFIGLWKKPIIESHTNKNEGS
jgi:hypothetical protein